LLPTGLTVGALAWEGANDNLQNFRFLEGPRSGTAAEILAMAMDTSNLESGHVAVDDWFPDYTDKFTLYHPRPPHCGASAGVCVGLGECDSYRNGNCDANDVCVCAEDTCSWSTWSADQVVRPADQVVRPTDQVVTPADQIARPVDYPHDVTIPDDTLMCCKNGQVQLREQGCSRCESGRQQEGNACVDCDAGKYADAVGSIECINCAAGKYNSDTASTEASACINCDNGKYSDAVSSTTADVCIACDAGKYADAVGSIECIECDAGKYNSATASTEASACIDCDKGKYSDARASSSIATVCIDCDAGTYADAVGSNECIDCVIGSQTEDTGVGDGTFMEVGASACVTCTMGQYSAHATGGADCIDCVIGSQTEDVGVGDGTFMEVGASACVMCTMGQYSAHAIGGAGCIDCIAGKYLELPGSAEAGDCIDCAAGKYAHATGIATSGHCISCDVGKYVSNAGSDEARDCISCTSGMYANQVGSTTCINCAANTYSDRVGSDTASSCINCDAGKAAAAGSNNVGKCGSCPRSTYGAVAGGPCISCPHGKHSMKTGGTVTDLCVACADCLDCGPGKYVNVKKLQIDVDQLIYLAPGYTETLGSCRYNSDKYNEYAVVECNKYDIQGCLAACTARSDCDAVNMENSGRYGKDRACSLFSNTNTLNLVDSHTNIQEIRISEVSSKTESECRADCLAQSSCDAMVWQDEGVFTRIESGKECQSSDQDLGDRDTVEECSQECRSTPNCKFFIYGEAGSGGENGGDAVCEDPGAAQPSTRCVCNTKEACTGSSVGGRWEGTGEGDCIFFDEGFEDAGPETCGEANCWYEEESPGKCLCILRMEPGLLEAACKDQGGEWNEWFYCADAEGVQGQGREECVATGCEFSGCGTVDCTDGHFCDFEVEPECQECTEFTDARACDNDDLPDAGAADCASRCFRFTGESCAQFSERMKIAKDEHGRAIADDPILVAICESWYGTGFPAEGQDGSACFEDTRSMKHEDICRQVCERLRLECAVVFPDVDLAAAPCNCRCTSTSGEEGTEEACTCPGGDPGGESRVCESGQRCRAGSAGSENEAGGDAVCEDLPPPPPCADSEEGMEEACACPGGDPGGESRVCKSGQRCRAGIAGS
jgi:hypothetical protein